MTPPFPIGHLRWSFGMRHARAPNIYAGEQEQPYDVDEVPVPRRKLEAEVLFWIEVPGHRAQQTNGQEDGADDHMSSMEARRHEESSAVDVATEVEGRVRVFVGLDAGEREAEQNGENEPPFQAL